MSEVKFGEVPTIEIIKRPMNEIIINVPAMSADGRKFINASDVAKNLKKDVVNVGGSNITHIDGYR